ARQSLKDIGGSGDLLAHFVESLRCIVRRDLCGVLQAAGGEGIRSPLRAAFGAPMHQERATADSDARAASFRDDTLNVRMDWEIDARALELTSNSVGLPYRADNPTADDVVETKVNQIHPPPREVKSQSHHPLQPLRGDSVYCPELLHGHPMTL